MELIEAYHFLKDTRHIRKECPPELYYVTHVQSPFNPFSNYEVYFVMHHTELDLTQNENELEYSMYRKRHAFVFQTHLLHEVRKVYTILLTKGYQIVST